MRVRVRHKIAMPTEVMSFNRGRSSGDKHGKHHLHQHEQMTTEKQSNKVKYSALDAPSSHLREGVTDQRPDGQMDGPMDTPCYRYATVHLKRK